jgi:SAM-dependent methyltransferase
VTRRTSKTGIPIVVPDNFSTADVIIPESHSYRSLEYLNAPLDKEVYQELARRCPISTPQVLDFGAGFGDCAKKLKAAARNRISMHISTLEPIAACCVDFAHVTTGELIPKSWDSKFDLIYSQGTLHFCSIPQLVVKNLALSLAPGGTLVLTSEGFASHFLSDRFRNYLVDFYNLQSEPNFSNAQQENLYSVVVNAYYRNLERELTLLNQERGITCEWFEGDNWVAQRNQHKIPFFLRLQRPQ